MRTNMNKLHRELVAHMEAKGLAKAEEKKNGN